MAMRKKTAKQLAQKHAAEKAREQIKHGGSDEPYIHYGAVVDAEGHENLVRVGDPEIDGIEYDENLAKIRKQSNPTSTRGKRAQRDKGENEMATITLKDHAHNIAYTMEDLLIEIEVLRNLASQHQGEDSLVPDVLDSIIGEKICVLDHAVQHLFEITSQKKTPKKSAKKPAAVTEIPAAAN